MFLLPTLLLDKAVILKLKVAIALLLTLLLKAKVRLGFFSVLGGIASLVNILIFAALVAALVLQQQQARRA